MASARSQPGDTLPSLYPAVCHLSVVAEAREGIAAAVAAALEGFSVVSPLAAGGGTPSGRHSALRVSVSVGSREELDALDRALRAVPGVRMVL